MPADTPLIAMENALQQMLTAVTPVNESCLLPLAHCLGRVTAQPIHSPLNLPPFDNSAMDGYAVRLADLSAGAPLPIAGTSLAGQPFDGIWQPASCIRIMTGAMLPAGCEAVIIQEQAQLSAAGVHFPGATASAITPGQNIRRCGEHIRQGDVVINAGHRLNATSLPLLASLGISQLAVLRKLRVAIFSTGDELRTPGQPLAAGQIYDSNRLATQLLLEQAGCEVIDLGIIADDPDALRQAFRQADSQADVVISSAGVSVGDKDHTKTILQQQGEVVFWRLAMKPGKPFAFGRLTNSWFCGLPGNPVSAFITFCQLVRPLLAKLSGIQGELLPQRFRLRCAQPLHKIPGRLEFQRGILRRAANGEPEVVSTGAQDSHRFRSLNQANCFIVLERERADVAAGEWVEVELFTTNGA